MATRKGTVLLMARPFFPWMGNKEKLVPYIHQLIPPHVKQFTEVFGGSGAVILGLQPKKGRLDIYNDLNDDLFNVFCCVKEKSFSLSKELRFLPVHGRTPFAFYRDMAAHEPDFYRHIEEEKRVVAESTCFTEEEIRELLAILDGNATLILICLTGVRPFTYIFVIGPMRLVPAGRELRQSPLILAYHAAL